MAFKSSIRVTGESEAARLLEQTSKRFVPSLVQDAIYPAAVIVRDEARRRAPVGFGRRPDGSAREHLRDAIYASKGKSGLLSVIAGVNLKRVPHAHLVEYGTAPHFIRPKKGKFLWVLGRFLTFVKHPGAVKRPFFRPAARRSQPAVLKAIEEGCRKLLSGLVTP